MTVTWQPNFTPAVSCSTSQHDTRARVDRAGEEADWSPSRELRSDVLPESNASFFSRELEDVLGSLEEIGRAARAQVGDIRFPDKKKRSTGARGEGGNVVCYVVCVCVCRWLCSARQFSTVVETRRRRGRGASRDTLGIRVFDCIAQRLVAHLAEWPHEHPHGERRRVETARRASRKAQSLRRARTHAKQTKNGDVRDGSRLRIRKARQNAKTAQRLTIAPRRETQRDFDGCSRCRSDSRL